MDSRLFHRLFKRQWRSSKCSQRTTLIPSTPFALAPFLQENFSNIEIYKDLKKQNKNIRENAIKKSNFK